MSNIGIPIKLLYEAEGMKVTVEVRYSVEPRRVQQPCPARFLTTFSFHEKYYPNWEIDSFESTLIGCM